MSFLLREAGVESAALLAAIHAACFAGKEVWGEASFRTLLEGAGTRALLAAEGEEPAGFALTRAVAGEAELLTLAVRPAFRRRGVGKALLARLLRPQGGYGVLFLEVSEGNAAARALYEGGGLRPAGRRKRYYPDGSDAIVMSAHIP